MIYPKVTADEFKCEIIRKILEERKEIVIGNECCCGRSRKVVDLVTIENKKVIVGYEIKSDSDNFIRLYEQIEQYKKVFDYVVLVVGARHREKGLEFCSKQPSLGCWCLNENGIEIVRRGKKYRNTDKMEMLYTMSTKYLRQVCQNVKNLSADDMRRGLCKKSKEEIHRLLVGYMNMRYGGSFELFLKEDGLNFTQDDLSTLTGAFEVVLE